MKLNLTENLETLEDFISRHVLRSIESNLPEHPRFVADREAAEFSKEEENALESFLSHPEQRELEANEAPRPIVLRKGFTWGGPGALAHPVAIECISGSLWLTLGHNERADIVLPAGQTYVSQAGELPVMEALENSTVRIHQRD